jgi:hypothetical protein
MIGVELSASRLFFLKNQRYLFAVTQVAYCHAGDAIRVR